jgi:hypothetical protein
LTTWKTPYYYRGFLFFFFSSIIPSSRQTSYGTKPSGHLATCDSVRNKKG